MIKKNSTSYFLLLALEKSIELEVNLVDFAYNNHKLLSGIPRKMNYGDFYQSIKTLRKNGYIESNKETGRIILKLTDVGKEQAILQKILTTQKWDGKWRIVIFDIPENKRKFRDILRSKLREWEFVPWQKSVWVSKKSVEAPLKDFIKEVGLSQWVKVLIADDLN